MNNLSAKNPLSIIALFISLIYGICALLLGASVDDMQPINQERLVWFIILFPIGILSAFLFLVTKHHQKLYGPSDFRTDEGFLSAAEPRSIGEKYLEQAVPDIEGEDLEAVEGVGEAEDETPQVIETQDEAQPIPEPPLKTGLLVQKVRNVSDLYLLEGLVMQELQSEYDGAIRRDVEVSSPSGSKFQIDAIIETSTGPVIVEVKHLRMAGEFTRRIRDGLNALNNGVHAFRALSSTVPVGLLAIVVVEDASPDEIERLRSQARKSTHIPSAIKIFEARKLFEKYGFSTNTTM